MRCLIVDEAPLFRHGISQLFYRNNAGKLAIREATYAHTWDCLSQQAITLRQFTFQLQFITIQHINILRVIMLYVDFPRRTSYTIACDD